MSDLQGCFGKANQEENLQGKYGGQQQNSQKDYWVCPNCETVNTEEVCFLCGYKKKILPVKEVRGKRIAIILTAILVLVLGILLAIPNGWQEKDGNYYYYTWGRKNTGKMEIDGAMYFFDADGTMHTGWRKVPGNIIYYYGTDGRMVSGECVIDDERYLFGEDGRLDYKISVLNGTAIPDSRESAEEISYMRNNGTEGSGKYQILYKPIENCLGITVTVNIVDVESGNVDDWAFYIRQMDGQWLRVGEIDVHNKTGTSTFSFDWAVHFDAYALLCESLEDEWMFSFDWTLSDVHITEFFD